MSQTLAKFTPANPVNVKTARPGTKPSGKRRRWDDVSMRTKVYLLVTLGAVWGAVVGVGSSAIEGLPVWLPLVGVGVLVMGLSGLADRWVCRPVQTLVTQAARACLPDRPLSTDSLPRDRFDEVGELARAMHQLAKNSRRDFSEARQLRKTMDERVRQATQRATGRLTRLAMRDPLTQLGNRRFLEGHFESLFQQCRQSSVELACVMIDLDGFKPVNDTQGHFVGDELLRFFGGLIRSQIRNDDYAVRYGGDEFALLMPGLTQRRCHDLLNYLQDLLSAHGRAVLPRGISIGLSAGVAWMVGDGCRTHDQLLKLADDRLYQVKRENKAGAAVAR